MAGNAWKYSHKLDDVDLEFLQHDFITIKQGVQMAALKEQKNLENMTQYTVIAILNDALPKKSVVKKVSFSEKKLMKYFPADYPASKCERIITELLEKWKAEQEAGNDA